MLGSPDIRSGWGVMNAEVRRMLKWAAVGLVAVILLAAVFVVAVDS